MSVTGLHQPLSRAELERETARLQTWVEVSASSYSHNVEFFRQQVGDGVEVALVVKANAYGHGIIEVSKLAVEQGVALLCVHSLREAQAIRAAGIDTETLILGPVAAECYDQVAGQNFRLVLFGVDEARSMAAAARRCGTPIHVDLKIETGTNRQGAHPDDLDEIIAEISSDALILRGVYTHFANIEDTTELSYAEEQLARFETVLTKLEEAGFDSFQTHAACTAASLVCPAALFDFVRLGIGQYGLWPSRENRLAYALHALPDPGDPGDRDVDSILRPVLTWKTRVGQLKWVDRDSFIGYGCSYQTTRRSRIAVLPIGYSDGYDRSLSNQGFVLVNGQRAPVRGRICMNLMMVDVTDIGDVEVGDEVVVLGSQGAGQVSAEQLARLAGSINYEIVARLSGEMPRFVVGE